MPDQRRPVVLWDLDRTLADLIVSLDDIARWKADIKKRLAAFGVATDLSPFLSNLERARRQIEVSHPDETAALFEGIYADIDRWESEALQTTQLHHRLCGLALSWQRAGAIWCVVTNNGPTVARWALRQIAHWADDESLPAPAPAAVVSRSADLLSKPAPDGFLRALSSCDWTRSPPTSIWVIGDSPSDISAAKALIPLTACPVFAVRAADDHLSWPDEDPWRHANADRDNRADRVDSLAVVLSREGLAI